MCAFGALPPQRADGKTPSPSPRGAQDLPPCSPQPHSSHRGHGNLSPWGPGLGMRPDKQPAAQRNQTEAGAGQRPLRKARSPFRVAQRLLPGSEALRVAQGATHSHALSSRQQSPSHAVTSDTGHSKGPKGPCPSRHGSVPTRAEMREDSRLKPRAAPYT